MLFLVNIYYIIYNINKILHMRLSYNIKPFSTMVKSVY